MTWYLKSNRKRNTDVEEFNNETPPKKLKAITSKWVTWKTFMITPWLLNSRVTNPNTITLLPPVKFVAPPFRNDAGQKPQEPPVTNFNCAFQPETASRLNYLDTFAPIHCPISNLALAEPSLLQLKDGFVVQTEDTHITRFFLLGLTASSTLFSGANARGMTVIFSGRTFPRAMAVAGRVFKRDGFILTTFQQGVSLSTYKRTQNLNIPTSPKLKTAPRSPFKRQAASSSKSMDFWKNANHVSPSFKSFAVWTYQHILYSC